MTKLLAVKILKQVLMFYHLKTRHCVNTVHRRRKGWGYGAAALPHFKGAP